MVKHESERQKRQRGEPDHEGKRRAQQKFYRSAQAPHDGRVFTQVNAPPSYRTLGVTETSEAGEGSPVYSPQFGVRE